MGVNEIIKIGNRIKKLRKEKGLTQREMSDILNIPYSTYSNYENNNREPSVELLDKVGEILGVSRFDLLYDPEKLIADLEAFHKKAERLLAEESESAEEHENLYNEISDALMDFDYFVPEYEKQTEEFFDPISITITDSHDEEIATIDQSRFVELGEKMLSDIEKYKEMRILYFLKELKDEED
jgi:transcriptional regulator with XRE-family HTH domain